MALSRFERWTREVLEQEARKRGIRDPEVRSHAELARMILRHDYASPHSLRNARKLVGALLETASATLRGPLPPTAAPTTVQRPDPYRKPQPPVSPAAPAERTVVATAQSTQPSANAEPAERTVATAAQSVQTAVADPAQAPAIAPKAPAANSVHLDNSRPVPRELHVRWQISEQAAARARSLLGSEGELAVRLVSVRADPTHVVLSDVTEHGPIESAGEWVAELASADTHCVTAVGVRNAGRFVSIVHKSSRPARLD